LSFVQSQTVVIVDASVAVELLVGSDTWADRWEQWLESGMLLLVPAHFGIEVANALLRGLRLSDVDVVASLGRLWATGIEPADRGPQGLVGAVELAQRHRLTVYDAAYLDLALDVEGEVATLDPALRDACEAEGVPLAV
jgi:predicted nucleic acid-binding protein